MPTQPDGAKTGRHQNKDHKITRITSRTMQPENTTQHQRFKGVPPAHTNHTKNSAASTTQHATNPRTKVHWHTIEFSNNTRIFTHHQANHLAAVKSDFVDTTQTTTRLSNPQRFNQSVVIHIFLCRPTIVFLTAISPAQLSSESVWRGVVGLADSI